jgi:DNA-directed RNA polymerase subunit RPC12/RpoP
MEIKNSEYFCRRCEKGVDGRVDRDEDNYVITVCEHCGREGVLIDREEALLISKWVKTIQE